MAAEKEQMLLPSPKELGTLLRAFMKIRDIGTDESLLEKKPERPLDTQKEKAILSRLREIRFFLKDHFSPQEQALTKALTGYSSIGSGIFDSKMEEEELLKEREKFKKPIEQFLADYKKFYYDKFPEKLTDDSTLQDEKTQDEAEMLLQAKAVPLLQIVASKPKVKKEEELKIGAESLPAKVKEKDLNKAGKLLEDKTFEAIQTYHREHPKVLKFSKKAANYPKQEGEVPRSVLFVDDNISVVLYRDFAIDKTVLPKKEYHQKAYLGTGTMGRNPVKLGQIQETKEWVAVKIMKSKPDDKELSILKATGRLVGLVERQNEKGEVIYYLVQKLVRGEPLVHLKQSEEIPLISLAKNKKSVPQALKAYMTILITLLQAVQRLHEAGIIHGDLHTNNILMNTENGRFKSELVDFGQSSMRAITDPALEVSVIVENTACLHLLVDFFSPFSENMEDNIRIFEPSLRQAEGNIRQGILNSPAVFEAVCKLQFMLKSSVPLKDLTKNLTPIITLFEEAYETDFGESFPFAFHGKETLALTEAGKERIQETRAFIKKQQSLSPAVFVESMIDTYLKKMGIEKGYQAYIENLGKSHSRGMEALGQFEASLEYMKKGYLLRIRDALEKLSSQDKETYRAEIKAQQKEYLDCLLIRKDTLFLKDPSFTRSLTAASAVASFAAYFEAVKFCDKLLVLDTKEEISEALSDILKPKKKGISPLGH